MDGNDNNEETDTIEVSIDSSEGATISYISGFPKQQLRYAKQARDEASRIEALFKGSEARQVPAEDDRNHQRHVLSTLVNSISFLEGQKYWFIYRLEERRWDFENREEIQKTGWNGLEDAFTRMIRTCGEDDTLLKESEAYKEVKVLRRFRNDLSHFEPFKVQAGNETEEYDVTAELQEREFPQNPVGVNNSYPFNWLSYELAERSIRMCFTLWRFFGRSLQKEDEFLTGVPAP